MIGADIEFFIKSKETGKIIPACGKIGGEKGKPRRLSFDHSILEDGAAVELNYTTTDYWPQLLDMLVSSPRVIEEHTGYSVAPLPEARIAGLKKYRQAMEIGCVEDFDAYAAIPEVPREIPDIGSFGTYRFAGGHIHISYNVEQIPPFVVARFMDVYITCPLIWWYHERRGEDEAIKVLGAHRRKFYGLPGLYRPKPYGVEYRTLSNYFTFTYGASEFLATNVCILNKLLDQEVEKLNKLYLHIDWELVSSAIRELDFVKIKKVITSYPQNLFTAKSFK